ncbi:SRPBCC family protein [Robiginitomaculum antarcticum]|uniref:SRPBCC family protein n=1 Tax=Robiginitomaculum antarcticum TaxID=437507 RepID=UPI00035EEEC0|nr:SRPBCC family protein [Robiginitomaculum antarcticum]
MPKAHLQEIMPYRPDDLLGMVTNVEQYPSFLNFVSSMRVLGPRERIGDIETFEAQMNVAYKMVSESVRCSVTIDYAKRSVIVRNSDKPGPLKTLINDWKFTELSDGRTVIDFMVNVTLKSFPLNLLAAQKFGSVTDKIMDIFKLRAAQILRPVKEDPKIDLAAEFKDLNLKRLV